MTLSSTAPPPAENTPEPRTCFDCDSPVGKTWLDHTFTYGIGADAAELTVHLPVHVCAACGLEFLDGEAETLKHEAICAHLGVLTPDDIREIRKKYGMSRAAFAKVTGLGEATLNRWENALLIQSAANDRYLRLLKDAANMRTLRRLTAEPTTPSSATSAGRFRRIKVSPEYLQQQSGFALCPAA